MSVIIITANQKSLPANLSRPNAYAAMVQVIRFPTMATAHIRSEFAEEPPEGRTCIAFPPADVVFNGHGFRYEPRVAEDHIVGLERADNHPEDGVDHKQPQGDDEQMRQSMAYNLVLVFMLFPGPI